MLRTFIAVKIAPTPGLRRLHARLSEMSDRFRPVALGNLHVTLKFLGDTSEEQVPVVSTVLKRIVESRTAFHAELCGVGAFPNERRPSVIWVGLDQVETLCRIADDLDHELAALGFVPEDRAFQPHLTLLRIKSRPSEALLELLAEESQADYGMTPIDKVEFLQSELTRNGARYSTLATFALASRNGRTGFQARP